MTRVKVAELKNNLSKHLRAVERGEQVEVTDRDRPIARIVPVGAGGVAVRIIPAARAFTTVRGRRFLPVRRGIGSLDLLVADRRRR